MKVYRKDRLFQSDKEKSDQLAELLKNVRVTDESAYFSNTLKTRQSSRPTSPPASPNQGTRGNGGGAGPKGGIGGPSPSGQS